MFSGINYLSNDIQQRSYNADHSIKKISSTGNAIKQAAYSGGGGGTVSFAARLNNSAISKRNSINAFQNTITFLQAQADGLRQAEKIYQRMQTLAQKALDPMLGISERELITDEFNDLLNQSAELRGSKFNNTALFDDLAASTQYEVNFGDGELANLTNNGAAIDVNEEKDVLYNKGIMTVDVNGGNAPERYTIEQGGELIFDTGLWKTKSNARNYDFDRFIVEFGPDQQTTFKFVPLPAGGATNVDIVNTPPGYPDNVTNSNSAAENQTYDNKSTYLQQLGLSDDGTPSGWDTRIDTKYTTLGQVTTNSINSDSSVIKLRVESPSSIFQVKGSFSLPEIEKSISGGEHNLQVELNKIGLGLMRVNDESSGFPFMQIDTIENAKSALESLEVELDGIVEQMGRLRSNFNRVEISIDAMTKFTASENNLLSRIGDSDISVELLELSKSKIKRQQSASMMAQAIHVNQDVVDILIA